jgi:diguanylate cyclase
VRGLTQQVKGDVGRHQASLAEAQAEVRGFAGDSESSMSFVIERLLRDNESLLAQLCDAEVKFVAQEEALQQYMLEARQDALTSLENRRAFDQDLVQRFAEWQRQGTEFCLAMVDVDHFKRINDEYGHPVGDEVLKGIARVLAGSVRQMDVVSRLGGEEFGVLLPCTTLEEGQGVAERIRQYIAEMRLVANGIVVSVTASVGLANVRAVSSSAELLEEADKALYAAKNAGRDRAYYYSVAGYDPVPRLAPNAIPARAAAAAATP